MPTSDEVWLGTTTGYLQVLSQTEGSPSAEWRESFIDGALGFEIDLVLVVLVVLVVLIVLIVVLVSVVVY